MNIIKASITRPSVIIVILSMLIIGGIYSYKSLNYELVPNIEVNMITISTVYGGASPNEIESTVTKKIEDAVLTLENVKKIQAFSYESLSIVMVQLNPGADVDFLLNDAQRKINAIRSDLPDDADEPSLSKFSLSDLPIIKLGVTAQMSSQELYDLVDRKIQPELSRISGVAQVVVMGGQEREIRVSLDPKKLEGYGLSITQVQQIIAASNLDFPIGKLKTRENNTTIRLAGKFKTVEELRNLTIASQNGINIRLSDVADVQDTEQEVEKIARINQENTLLLQITKQTDANAVAVSELVRAKMGQIEEIYKENNLKLDLANDTSEFTLAAANSVVFDLALAVFLVAAVMLLFLHSFRNAVIVMVSIPTSLIATFIGMFLLGFTLNLMSLIALSLVVGILVDDAIVVMENIHRHMEMGKNKVRAAYDGAMEIGFTVTAITLVIVVVFLPIALSSGLVSDIIHQFCVTVIIATMLSLFMSFTTVPWLYSRFGKLEHLSEKSLFGRFVHWFEAQLKRFTHFITNILKWSFRNKFATFILVLLLFFGSIALVPFGFIGGEFFPRLDKGEFVIQLELPKDASVEQANFMTQKAENYVRQLPEVQKMITTVGQTSSGFGGTQATAYKSEIQVVLVDKKQRADNTTIYAAKLQRKLEEVLVGAKITTAPVGLMGVEDAPIQLTVMADEVEIAQEYAEKVAELLKTIDGATGVELSSEDGNPEITVQVDRDKMTSLGLNVAVVGQTMRMAFNGDDNSKFRMGDSEYDINIVFDEANRGNIENVKNLLFTNAMGQQIKLTQFADVSFSSGPSKLDRYDRSPAVTVKAKVVGKPSGTVASEWEAKFSKLDKPGTVRFIWQGDMENQSEGFGTLLVGLAAAILLVYMVMVILYDSFSRPFVVLFSIPLSFIGALWALAIANQTLNVFTLLGVIMLIGLVAKNAIMLVDFANHRKQHGEDTVTALIQANHARLRPILMTTIAMVFGMIPIAMASGAGAEMFNGLAIVIIGGLISSLFLTLIIVPLVYLVMDVLMAKFKKGEKVNYEKQMIADYEHIHIKEEHEL
ncbi:efflux RND transporter permease subunit [Capnocytophaga catalasegens]|nr:efflux RND transporter permease subunit [Capnocytophaga catalasegens]